MSIISVHGVQLKMCTIYNAIADLLELHMSPVPGPSNNECDNQKKSKQKTGNHQ